MKSFATVSLLAAWICSVSAQTACPDFDPALRIGTVANSSLTEISGIAASRQNPGVIWAHDDSGDVNRFFAMRTNGAHLGMFYLSGVSAVDCEDMAIGPGPEVGQDYLYLSDTGNNTLGRSTVTIYRVAEPTLAGLPVGVQTNLPNVVAFPFQYPDGNRDVETLLVDPWTGDFVLLTRDRSLTGFTHVYVYPVEQQTPGQVQVVTYVTTLASAAEIKGGDVSVNGESVILRRHSTTSNVPGWLYSRATGTALTSVFFTEPCLVPFASEPQGEAVTFEPNMLAYYTISEGAAQPIYHSALMTIPLSPASGSATATSPASVQVLWADSARNEAGYLVERSADNETFTPFAVLGAGSTNVIDSTVAAATTYWYRVAAFNNAGTSPALTLSVTTPASLPPTPAAPTGLTATANSKSQITLRWTDASSNEDSFKIERSLDGKTFAQIASVASNVTSFVNSGLAANKLYYYRVRAFNAGGNSAYSGTSSARTLRK